MSVHPHRQEATRDPDVESNLVPRRIRAERAQLVRADELIRSPPVRGFLELRAIVDMAENGVTQTVRKHSPVVRRMEP